MNTTLACTRGRSGVVLFTDSHEQTRSYRVEDFQIFVFCSINFWGIFIFHIYSVCSCKKFISFSLKRDIIVKIIVDYRFAAKIYDIITKAEQILLKVRAIPINNYLSCFHYLSCVTKKTQHSAFATSMDPDQPVHPGSLIRIHAVSFFTCNRVGKRTAWILIRQRGCACWSGSMRDASPICWLCRGAAQF
jgi:hypothetical protein